MGAGHAARWAAFVGPTWAEVDLDAIAANVRWVRGRLAPGVRLLAVVKADAYGHGAPEVARVVLAEGADALGVSTVAEGLALREEGIGAPILVLAPAASEELPAALEAGLILTVADLEGARGLAGAAEALGVPARAHVKCDTGMGRYGFAWTELGARAEDLRRLEGAVRWEGVFTHMARGADAAFTRCQLARFLTAVDGAAARGLRFPVRHAAASAALLAVPEAQLDMVRIGSLLYGECPAGLSAPGLRRAFALWSRVAQVRELPRGATVGYGAAWRARRPTRVATVPVGFADGLGVQAAGRARRLAVRLRALGRAVLEALGLRPRTPRQGEVWWRDHRLRILGRVAMQQVTVALGELPVRPGDVVAVHVPSVFASGQLARLYLRDGVCVAARRGRSSLAAPAPAPWPARPYGSEHV